MLYNWSVASLVVAVTWDVCALDFSCHARVNKSLQRVLEIVYLLLRVIIDERKCRIGTG